MRFLCSLAFLGIVFLLIGCGPTGRDVPGTIESGSIEQVATMSEGGGAGLPTSSDMGVIPLTGWSKPDTTPLVRSGRAIPIWVFPSVSRDERSWHEGFWIWYLDKRPRWAMEEAKRHRITFDGLSNIKIDDNGQLVVARSNTGTISPDEIRNIRSVGEGLDIRPWSETGTSEEVRRTTIVVDDGQGQLHPVSQTTQPLSTPDSKAYESAIQNAQALMDNYRNAGQ